MTKKRGNSLERWAKVIADQGKEHRRYSDFREIKEPVYWSGKLGELDDFGNPYTDGVMYDAETVYGPWANMSKKSFFEHTNRRLGTGSGQRYERQSDGRWLKVDG